MKRLQASGHVKAATGCLANAGKLRAAVGILPSNTFARTSLEAAFLVTSHVGPPAFNGHGRRINFLRGLIQTLLPCVEAAMHPSRIRRARLERLARHVAAASLCSWALQGLAGESSWRFAVTLDGSPIGEHDYTVKTDGSEREVTSAARLRVKVLGITVYRYDHRVQERWENECLRTLDARTDDDGQRNEVQGRVDEGAFVWQVRPFHGPSTTSRAVCPMSFAYWNPAIASRHTLLDPGSGQLQNVQFTPLAATTIEVHGAPTRVRGLRILGLKNPVDVWYQGDQWVGLDTRVDRHTLRYRLP